MESGAHTPGIAFVGRSGSGKTTLTEQVIAALTARGHAVGSIKHHSHKGFEIDVPGKDSWRHRQAGSLHTVIASPDQLVSIQTLDHELDFDEIIADMNDVDIVIVEGYRHAGLPTIELFRDGNDRDAQALEKCDTLESVAIASDMAEARDRAVEAGLPCFELDDIESITIFIEDRILNEK